MARLTQLAIENYKSIGEQIIISFPQNMPVIFIGENNSGKTNIIRAIDLIFGEWHPKYKDLDDHDFFGRNRNSETEIIISASVTGMQNRLGRAEEFTCGGFTFNAKRGLANDFAAIQTEDGELNVYVSNVIREELCSVLVSSEQNLSYQLSYSSKYTLLSKVMSAFHHQLTSNEQRVEKLKNLFDQIKSTFNEVEEFKTLKENMSSIAGEMIANMTHGLKLDFSAYDPSNYFKSLRVYPVEGDEIRNFDELGTGQQQILALSFAQAYAKSFKGQNLILLIDEPEAHLHPLAQKWLAKMMFQMAKDGLQLVITSHSPNFINLDYLEGIYLVRKNQEGTEVISTDTEKLAKYCVDKGSHKDKTKKETIVSFYSGSATDNILKGFFANCIILVEGPSEELALPIYLEKVGLDSLKDGIDIIGVGGKGNIAKWWRLFSHFDIPVFICFDNDAKNDESGVNRKDALKTIGIPEIELDEVLSIEDWNINNGFCVFGKDFESTMRNSFNGYEEIENNLKVELGNSKPIIAREVSKRLTYNNDEEGWKKIHELVEIIKSLTSVGEE